jgi:hypothetical protein
MIDINEEEKKLEDMPREDSSVDEPIPMETDYD